MAPPTSTHYLKVKINSFKTPSCVWALEEVVEGMSEERRALHQLELTLATHAKRTECPPRLEPDEYVAVQSPHDERLWNRGKIECCLQLSTGNKYRVRLVDYGVTVVAKPKHLRQIPARSDVLPFQAMLLVLDGIGPVNLGITSNHDTMQQKFSKQWTAAAEKFVEEEILKKYHSAYFLEGSYPRKDNIRYGDLLVDMGKGNGRESLKQLLCKMGFAESRNDEFLEETPKAHMDGPELCHSPLTLESHTDTSSSCSPSPAGRMMSENSIHGSLPNKPSRTMGEYAKNKEAERLLSSKPNSSPQEPAKSGSESEPNKRKSQLNVNLLKSMMKSGNRTTLSPTPPSTPMPQQIPSSQTSQETFNVSEGPVELPLNVAPKDLGSKFVPAGRSIRQEPKLDKHSPNSSKCKVGNFQEHAANYNSDSSLSDSNRRPVYHHRPEPQSSVNGRKDNSPISPPIATKPGRSASTSTSDSDHSKAPLVQPTSMKDRLLRSAPRQDIKVDYTREENFLNRSLLLHGGFRPTPWMTYNDLKSKFSTHIEQYLVNNRWSHNILTIEKFMWPAIQQRQNLVMISPKGTGKTTSYIVPLMDFMVDLEEPPEGNGPLILILCAGSTSVSQIYAECVKLVNGAKKTPRVQQASGLALDQQFFIRMVNGCEVLITTPPCCLRLLTEFKNTYALNFARLQHFVLDQADVLMKRFLTEVKKIQYLIVAEQDLQAKLSDERDPIQVIVCSEKWEPELLSFSMHMQGNPLLFFNDCFEACVYGKLEVILHGTQSVKKPEKLLEILNEVSGLYKTVVFCAKSEVFQLKEYLEGFVSVLHLIPDASNNEIQAVRSQWNSTRGGEHYVLLCSDDEFNAMKLEDATCLIHYSLPHDDAGTGKDIFVKRLSAVLYNIPNMLDKKPPLKLPSIRLIMDESNAEQFPAIAQLMQRISHKIDSKLLEASKVETERKEKKTKENKLFCTSLKMYGSCQKTDCPNRHVYIANLDESNYLPKTGVITMQIMQVHNAGHYSVRLTEKAGPSKDVKGDGQYLKLALMMSQYAKDKDKFLADEIIVGDIYATETVEGLLNRVQVLEVLEKNKFGPSKVLTKFIDEGHLSSLKTYSLYSIPEDLKNFPAQVVDVFLCGLLPADRDDDYCFSATNCVRKLVSSTLEDGMKFFQGKILMSMTGSLWIDPLNIVEWLPCTQAYVVRQNLRKCLLDDRHALENPDHLPKLFKLCGQDESILTPAPVASKVRKPMILPKPDWAFLDCDVFEDIEFVCANNDSIMFMRKTKFRDLLNTLMNDIENCHKRENEEVAALSEGDWCLSRYKDDTKWYRAKILSKKEDIFTVFYVDFGDEGDVSIEELNTIPEWAVTRLPFQAIECSLAGVASCESVDKLYDVLDGRDLVAQVCDREKHAQYTGGRHYVIVVVDITNPEELPIVNKELLKLEGVETCEEQLKNLEIEIDASLFNRIDENNEPQLEENSVGNNIDPEFNLSDLEFNDDDLSNFYDDDDDVRQMEDFEVCGLDDFMDSLCKANPNIQAVRDSALRGRNEPGGSHQSATNNTVSSMVATSESSAEVAAAGKEHQKDEDLPEGDKEPSDWEEDVAYIGRFLLPALCSARPPRTKWFEDLYYIWIKIGLTGIDKYFLRCTYDRMQFSAFHGGRFYHVDEKLRGAILPESVQSSAKGFTVDIKMKKACSGVMWGRPFSACRYPWLSRDTEKAAVESSDDSDSELSLRTINKTIRSKPLRERRKRLSKDLKDRPGGPDLASDDENSNCDYYVIDSDDMF